MIRVKNIYYMLAYAFHVLEGQGYKKIAVENFENTANLMAAILSKGIEQQVKRGLGKDYLPQNAVLSSLRGKIDISESIKTQSILRRQMICAYDEFSVNSYMNRIIKTTMLTLLKADISQTHKKQLHKSLLYFSEVSLIDLKGVDWNIRYNRNNQHYRMLISICYLVNKGLLQTQTDGKVKLMDFLDEQRLHRLYEKFILEYFRREFPNIKANASQVPWQLDDDVRDLLPIMQTDIMLSHGNKILIIDAKCYSRTTHNLFGTAKLHSSNLYQIFTYVKNKEYELAGQPHEVSGMLLYAKTDNDISPDKDYSMSGNKICIRTLNLDADFSAIKKQLNRIALSFFPEAI